MNKNRLYLQISSKKGKGVKVKESLCFYNPKEVYEALTTNNNVVKWLKFISNHYYPPSNKKILLLYPCSCEKPYQKSRSYKTLAKTLDRLGNRRKKIHLITISEPFGLVPEEFYGEKTRWHDWENEWYDCPGLFKWWCDKYSQEYSKMYVNRCIKLLAMYVAEFLRKVELGKVYLEIVAFVRTYTSQLRIRNDHTHRRVIKRASEIAGVDVKILPDQTLVSEIVESKGRMAWDMHGVSHPMAQQYLLRYLKGILDSHDTQQN